MKTYAKLLDKHGQDILGSTTILRLDSRNTLSVQINDAQHFLKMSGPIVNAGGVRIFKCESLLDNERETYRYENPTFAIDDRLCSS